MKQRIATITLNPAYDLVGFCPNITLGEVNLIQTTGLHAAGKGINVAKVLTDLGINVTVGGLLGSENSDGFEQLFQQYGMTNCFQQIKGRTRINVKLTEDNSDVTDLNFSGLTVSPADWQEFVSQSLVWLTKIDIVIISGSLPLGVEPTALAEWMQKVHANGTRIIFDSNKMAFTAGLEVKPWLIKPNQQELTEWVGHPVSTLDDVIKAANQLRTKGIEHVVVSLGKEGAIWLNSEGIWLATPPKCQVVSTVGAGDSMVAGLAYGLLMGQSIQETLRLASAVAAMAVTQSNVGVSDKHQLTAMMSQVTLQPINEVTSQAQEK